MTDLINWGHLAHAVHRLHRRGITALGLVLLVLLKTKEAKNVLRALNIVCGLSGIRVEAPHKKGGPSHRACNTDSSATGTQLLTAMHIRAASNFYLHHPVNYRRCPKAPITKPKTATLSTDRNWVSPIPPKLRPAPALTANSLLRNQPPKAVPDPPKKLSKGLPPSRWGCPVTNYNNYELVPLENELDYESKDIAPPTSTHFPNNSINKPFTQDIALVKDVALNLLASSDHRKLPVDVLDDKRKKRSLALLLLPPLLLLLLVVVVVIVLLRLLSLRLGVRGISKKLIPNDLESIECLRDGVSENACVIADRLHVCIEKRRARSQMINEPGRYRHTANAAGTRRRHRSRRRSAMNFNGASPAAGYGLYRR
ncbi:hypothetical protein EVAR_80834_1 [Eumeta japonica]|uniref:Uncharacterized protein n=1 Tax=Eumeta variegata TaxID=151549 RepID=A0A4C1WCP1_EUMVA|nr:hypothetical protein EVAR_80834_1 [Eumeta japonica]